MFGISISELLLIGAVMLFVVKPQDAVNAIGFLRKTKVKINNFANNITKEILGDGLVDKKITVIDLRGKEQRIYDLSDLNIDDHQLDIDKEIEKCNQQNLAANNAASQLHDKNKSI